ncbi:MAG: hypothetical protein ACRBDX_08710 [Gammaproteobacteria bacterium]
MNNMCFHKILFIWLTVLLCTSCSTIQHFKQQAKYSDIQADISPSTLNKVNEFTSRTPFHKTYEFEFATTSNKFYALTFYISESSFSKSMLKHRKVNELHRNAVRIDHSRNILTALNKNLPKSESITWLHVAHQLRKDDARDGYQVMQEFIRLKIRDL